MKSYAIFQEYIWLVNTIYNAGKISLEDINRKWLTTEMSEGLTIPRSTFNRHKDAIQDMFGIYIECDKKDGFKYYIGNAEVLEEDSIQNWMLSTLSVGAMLSESRSVHDRVLLESIPSSGENLQRFIEAMKAGVRIHVWYKRYSAEYETEMIVEPYCLKLFNRRWYGLVKYQNRNSCFVLSFDRIRNLQLTGEKFQLMEDFVAAEWFKDCYGIVRDQDVELQKVVIRAFGQEVFYLRDLPLHPSQREIQTTDKWSDFEIQIRPSFDFYGPVLARGPLLKVLEPQWLADQIREQHQAAADLY